MSQDGSEEMMAQEDASYVRWDPPDTIFAALVGDISVDETRRRIAEIRSLLLDKPVVFFLIDFRHGGSISPEARAVAMGVTKDTNVRGTAIFGASLRLRVLITLISKAAKVLYKYDNRNPLFFCETEAQARAWLEERRATTTT
jgi:hypothetical protein